MAKKIEKLKKGIKANKRFALCTCVNVFCIFGLCFVFAYAHFRDLSYASSDIYVNEVEYEGDSADYCSGKDVNSGVVEAEGVSEEQGLTEESGQVENQQNESATGQNQNNSTSSDSNPSNAEQSQKGSGNNQSVNQGSSSVATNKESANQEVSTSNQKRWVEPVYKTVHHDAEYSEVVKYVCNDERNGGTCHAEFDSAEDFYNLHKVPTGG